ncbi:hypothetical protein KIJ00_02815 [Leuconostoc gelidum subsp. aenigmaticum]|uniref:hypothetical protein n=1 Tax=Leuconostoc gelidum TaxID=1244 RepID=UPI001CC33528|nr:hypothetical protein [Leuconostoc gelidum]MBZ6008197.1 hypothetical protein [Leuconostoc gelidum subsp. aenigmaticum]
MVSKRIVFFLHLLAISSIFLMMLVTIIETLTVSYNSNNTNFYKTIPTKQRRLLKSMVTSPKNNAQHIVIQPVVYQVNAGNITQQAAHVNKIIVNSQISIMSTIATEGGDNF